MANNAGAAGFVMLSIFNFALLIILGFVRALCFPHDYHLSLSSPSLALERSISRAGCLSSGSSLRLLCSEAGAERSPASASHGDVPDKRCCRHSQRSLQEDLPSSAPKPLEPEMTNNV